MKFLDAVKSLFSNRSEIKITISDIDNKHLMQDSKFIYDAKLNAAIENVESGKELITFSYDEFNKIVEEKY